ncbi:MAG: SpoIIIAH-like family protein [Clostridia bacterium]|nr:SpoIIIAH-like family protein [Clostridia bacterium]
MKNEKLKKLLSSKGAKSVAIACMALVIGLAVYLNYRWFYDPASSLGYGENNMDDNYSDSAETGGDASNESTNYFTATALDRQQARDEAIDVLKLVTENEEASEAAKAEASAKISQIAVDIQNEANIETLVKAKGFEECVAIISEDAVSVIVSADELLANQTAQILTIVYETTGISPEKVSIINKV